MTSIRRLFLGNAIDRCILMLLLLAIAWLWWRLYWQADEGETMVSVYHEQSLLARYPLHAKQPISITAHGQIGDTIVRIVDGKVSIIRSPCRLQRCVHSGWHHRHGDILACVPNHILVLIQGNQSLPKLDAIAE